MDKSTKQKCDYLYSLCGLIVSINNNDEYVFSEPVYNRTIKSTYTYPKAKLFAEGFKLGKEYARTQLFTQYS